ncbi:MAG: SAM-dependent methyltransferase [Chloroflexota bacterium]|nr:class I SAM-dependent methyltransferase [Chloroflexota bacterium]MBI5701898.1 class I SAM-dependent methyltransferase [Chloroflexota bacterium]
MPANRDAIRIYYDKNTKLFLAFNRTRQAENIHRALWMDGVRSHGEAMNASNELIRAEIETTASAYVRIADLGCGVGASLFHILPRLQNPQPAFGLTLSPVQARLAQQFARGTNLDKHILFIEADFTCTPLAGGAFDAVYSVEAVVHTAEPQNYFREASRLLRPGGKLILIDDYRANRLLSHNENRWLKAYMQGWHVPGVITVEQANQFAKASHLRMTKNQNLTPSLRLRRLPDALAQTLLFIGERLPLRHPILPSMLGSMALQQCLHAGTIEYRMLVFVRE